MTAKPTARLTPQPALSAGWTAFFEFLLEREEARQKDERIPQAEEATKVVKNERSCE